MSDVTVERILAPNPGLYTGPGTNTYLVASGNDVAVIDPGPISTAHRTAIESAIIGHTLSAVIVTHTHSDHAPLANPLASAFSVPAVGYAPGPDFDPHQVVGEGDVISVGSAQLEVLYTPGHAADHVCLRLGRMLFTGDHIMGGSTVMVDDLIAYLASLERLRGVELDRMFPGHGPEIDNPGEVVDYYIRHRLEREQEIVDAVRTGAQSVGAVVEAVYADVDPALHRIAAYSVAAHLHKLAIEGVLEFRRPTVRRELWDALVTLSGNEDR